MSRRSRQSTPPPSAPRPKRFWLYAVAVPVALVVLAVVYLMPENPDNLFLEAHREIDADPERAAELAQRAVVANHGDFPNAHLLWCRALGRQQLWDEALGCFGSIQEPQRCDAAELMWLADEAAQANRTTLAELALEAANRPSPVRAEVLERLVATKYGNREHREVLELCQAWQDLEPTNPEPLEATMSVYQLQANYTQAAQVGRKLLELPLPREKQTKIRLALVGLLVDLAETKQARQEIDRLNDEGVSGPDLQLRHAQLLRLERRFAEALAKTEPLLDHEKTSLRARLLRGILYLDLGRFAEARDDLAEVIRQDRNNREGHYKLAQALLRLGRQDEAQKHLQVSRQLTEAAIRALGEVPTGKSSADGPESSSVEGQ